MLKTLFARRHQGKLTVAYPTGSAPIPEIFRGGRPCLPRTTAPPNEPAAPMSAPMAP